MAAARRFTVLLGVLLGVTGSLSGQQISEPSARIKDVRRSQWVSVEISVSASDKDLFVPYCGGGGTDTEFLCSLPTRLETKAKKGWSPVNYREGIAAVLGGLPSDKWKVRVVPAGQQHTFSYGFPKNDFGLERGQVLRYVVPVWPDEQSMRNDGQPILLVTPPFKCP